MSRVIENVGTVVVALLALMTVIHVCAAVPQSTYRDTGRIAISSDGNNRVEVLVPNTVLKGDGSYHPASGNFELDRDDVPAMPLALAMIAKAGKQDQLVHFHYNCGFVPVDVGKLIKPNRMKIMMAEVAGLVLGKRNQLVIF